MFQNYWFETGTPGFLIELIKKNSYFIPKFNGLQVNKSLVNRFDLEHLNLETILFQAGYLTIKRLLPLDMGFGYELGFPNIEVQMSFNDSLAALQRAAALARETAIQTNTNIVIEKDGKLVWISAEELRRQASEANESINPQPDGVVW